jgi:ribosomal protein S9
MAKKETFYGTGRRKSSIARVFLQKEKVILLLTIAKLMNICHMPH